MGGLNLGRRGLIRGKWAGSEVKLENEKRELDEGE